VPLTSVLVAGLTVVDESPLLPELSESFFGASPSMKWMYTNVPPVMTMTIVTRAAITHFQRVLTTSAFPADLRVA
jgi:hypothetical protein